MEKKAPIPQGKYVPATRFGQMIYTAGMTPRDNGILLMTGKVKQNAELEIYRGAVEQAMSNALVAAEAKLGSGERICQVLQLTVFVNGETDFTSHSRLADFATSYLCEKLGEVGIAARTAVGVATLPGDAPVEIQMVCAVEAKTFG